MPLTLDQVYDFEGNIEAAFKAWFTANSETLFVTLKDVDLPDEYIAITMNTGAITGHYNPAPGNLNRPEYDQYAADFEFLVRTPRDPSLSEGTPTATLRPAGADNDILMTGDTEADTAQILIDDDTDRTQLTADNNSGAITLTSGDKRVMVVTGDFGFGNGIQTYTLYPAGTYNGLPVWDNNNGSDFITILDYFQNGTYYVVGGAFAWYADPETAWPDEVTVWTPSGDNYNPPEPLAAPPTIVAHPATAAQAITELDALAGITAENAPGDDGSGFIATAGPVNFAPPNHQQRVALVRKLVSASFVNGQATPSLQEKLENYEIQFFRPSGTSYAADGIFDETTLTFDAQFSVLQSAWPVS